MVNTHFCIQHGKDTLLRFMQINWIKSRQQQQMNKQQKKSREEEKSEFIVVGKCECECEYQVGVRKTKLLNELNWTKDGEQRKMRKNKCK